MPDHPDPATDPVAAERIRHELEALFDTDRQLHASLEALREELSFRPEHEPKDSKAPKDSKEPKKFKEPPQTWLDSPKIQSRAALISKVLGISTCSIMLLSAAFCFVRLAVAKPLLKPAASPIAAPAAGAKVDE